MPDDIRAFLAIQLPDDVTAALGHLADQIARTGIGGLRPVRPENMHLTLKFFGDVNARQVEAIIDIVTHTAKSIRPFTLRLGNVGAYPNNRSPRVLWVGLDGDVAPLQDAHRRRAAEALFSAEFRSGLPVPVDRISLMRSILLPEGPQYTLLAEIPLSDND